MQKYSIILFAFLFLQCHSSSKRAIDDRPNIVFILADDLSWADLPIYGNQFNEAPHLDQLAKEGVLYSNGFPSAPVCAVARSSIIMFYSDHGADIPRHKRWLYNGGIKVPWIINVPEKYQHLTPNLVESKTDELVSFVDLAPTALHLAGLPILEHMEGRAFWGSNLSPQRKYIFAGRDRMDEHYDIQRAVRDKRFEYIRYSETSSSCDARSFK